MLAINQARKAFYHHARDKWVFSRLVKQSGNFDDLGGLWIGAIGFDVDEAVERVLVGDIGA
ncbi:hypothetical protein ASB1_12730 [Helicobacter heilmannii]|nr:hypothetical protein ASB1_12730 [Helicobacter heilmannii]